MIGAPSLASLVSWKLVLYSKGRGGSTPPSRTRQGPGDPGAFVISPSNTKQPALLDEGYGLLTFRR